MACKLEEAVQEINKLLALPAVNKEKIIADKLNLAKQSIEAQMKLLGAQVKPDEKINISSGTKGLPGALINHTVLSKKKGSIESDYPIEFNGTKYDSVESAYQDNKVDESKTKPAKEDSQNYKLMVELIGAKFANHPRLVSAVTKLGGLKYLENAVHQPTSKNTVWETGGQDWFMSAMKEAYVATNTVLKGNTAEGKKTMTYAGNRDSVLENTTNPDKFIENSLIKNTVYHYSESGTIDPNLKTNKEEKAIFFFKDRKSAENLQNFLNQGKEDRKGKIFEAKINVQDVEILDASMYDTGSLIDKSIEAKNNSKDAIVAENMTEMGVGADTQYGVFDIRNVLFTNAEPDEIKLENKPVKKEVGINTSITESYVKKGSVVKYQSNYYVVKKVNETANNVQLINKNGDSLPGTPGIDKVQFVKQLPIIKFNGVEYIYDEKNDRLYTQNGEKWKDKKDSTRAKIISSAMKEVHNKAITEPVKIVDQIEEVKEETKAETKVDNAEVSSKFFKMDHDTYYTKEKTNYRKVFIPSEGVSKDKMKYKNILNSLFKAIRSDLSFGNGIKDIHDMFSKYPDIYTKEIKEFIEVKSGLDKGMREMKDMTEWEKFAKQYIANENKLIELFNKEAEKHGLPKPIQADSVDSYEFGFSAKFLKDATKQEEGKMTANEIIKAAKECAKG